MMSQCWAERTARRHQQEILLMAKALKTHQKVENRMKEIANNVSRPPMRPASLCDIGLEHMQMQLLLMSCRQIKHCTTDSGWH